MFNKILLCYDGTRESRAALKQGAELAATCQAEVHLLAVVQANAAAVVGEAISAEIPVRERTQRAEEILREGVERLHVRGIRAEGHMATGEPVEEISRIARELHTDLIVLGHKTRSAFARWWRGSIGVSLLDAAHCSILICLEDPSEGSP